MKTTDECVTEAEKWLAEAEAWKGRYGPGELDDRARMISACSDAADTWTRLAELRSHRDVFPPEAFAATRAVANVNPGSGSGSGSGCGCVGDERDGTATA